MGSDDLDYSKDYSMEGSYMIGSRAHLHGLRFDEPIFRITIKPRIICKDHTAYEQDVQNSYQSKR